MGFSTRTARSQHSSDLVGIVTLNSVQHDGQLDSRSFDQLGTSLRPFLDSCLLTCNRINGRSSAGGLVPLYEYRCRSCGNQFTNRCSIDERDAALACPECSSGQVTRLIPRPAVFSIEENNSVRNLGTGSCGGCPSTNCSTCSALRAN